MALPFLAGAVRLLISSAARAAARPDASADIEKRKALVAETQQRIIEGLQRVGPPQTEIRVLGVSDCVAMLRDMNEKSRKKIVESAVRQAAKLMQQQVVRRTYDHKLRKERTGLMQSAVRASTSLERDTVLGFVTPNRRQGKSPFYWWFLERGTKGRANAKSKNKGRISPRPWVTPAFQSTSGQAIAKISAVIAAGVQRESSREARSARLKPF
jgi:HK97 gp10 family phage protein